jgi:hypothetical protein
MLTATLSYTAITRNFAQTFERTAESAVVARETKYYLDNIGKVKSVDDLLKNSRLYGYVLTAFDLTDMRNAKGLVRKVLEGGISRPDSLANTLHDRRYRALAAAFDFATMGEATTTTTATRQGTVDRFVQITLETNAGKQNEGARMALYFRRMAPSIASAFGILADKTLLDVVQTTFGLSKAMSFQSIDRQAQLVTKHLDVADLRDPAKLDKLIQRFTARYDAQHAQGGAPLSPFGTGGIGINPGLLSALANLKLGGF